MTKSHIPFKHEEDVRAYVKKLGNFYKQLAIYGLVNVGMILIWLLSGEGYFWPIWVILGWGIPLFFVAVDLHLLPKGVQDVMNSFMETLPFLRPEWESEQVNHILKKGVKKDKDIVSGTTKTTGTKEEALSVKKLASSTKKTTPKKNSSKKAVVKKTPKAAPKKLT